MKAKIVGNIFLSLRVIFALAVLAPPTLTVATPPTNVTYQSTTFSVPGEAPPTACNGGTAIFGINNHGDLVGNFGVPHFLLGCTQ
jgi:hypothetical protein